MPAKAKLTPEDMLADVLGDATRQEKTDTPQGRIATHEPARTKTDVSKVGEPENYHKLQIHIPGDLYMAMLMHKCLYGAARGERSLKDIGINALAAYVDKSLAEVRKHTRP